MSFSGIGGNARYWFLTLPEASFPAKTPNPALFSSGDPQEMQRTDDKVLQDPHPYHSGIQGTWHNEAHH
jgi:hypothetical protein